MATRKFKICGIETEIRHIGGEQQEIIVNNKSVPLSAKMYDLAKSLTVRVGDFVIAEHKDSEVDDFFNRMLTCHVKQILTEARDLTYAGEDFIFNFEYKKKVKQPDNTFKEIAESKELSVPLEEGFPVREVKKFMPEAIEGATNITKLRKVAEGTEPLIVTDYAEVVANSTIEFIAPISGRPMQISMRDGRAAEIIGATKEKDLNSNTGILAMMPKWKPDDDTTTWINFTADKIKKAHAVDLEYMRLLLKIYEGAVDTELEFEHPDKEGKFEYTDLLHEPSFFFLSGVA